MKPIKLVAFDIDGTLIPRDTVLIPENTKESIQKLKDKGIKICVATGRSSFFIQQDVIDTIHPDFYVTVNGQLVTDKDFNPIVEKQLDFDESMMVLQYCRDNDIGVGCKMLNSIDVYHDFDNYWPIYLHGIEENLPILKNMEKQPLLPEKKAPFGIFMIGDEDKIRLLSKHLKTLTLSYAYENAFELFDDSVGKGDGLEYVINHFGYEWDEVLAMGDAHNDIYMIEKAGIGIAMGNASEDLKEAAHFVTKDCNDDGVTHALKHFNIIE